MLSVPALRVGILTMQYPPWGALLARWRDYEALGFASVWVCDHFVGQQGEPLFEAWTVLAAAAMATERVRLGVAVTCGTFRQPAVLAKEALTVDHLSGGRLEVGIGAGWWEAEHAAFGIPFPPPGERVERFRETVEVVDRLLRTGGESVSDEGRQARLRNAPMRPEPVQRPRPPLAVGAQGPRMLEIVAAYADTWMASFGLDADQVGALNRVLDERCAALGRDPAALRRAFLWAPWVQALDPWSSIDAFQEFVGRYRDAGITDFVFDEPRPEQRRVLDRVAADLPSLCER